MFILKQALDKSAEDKKFIFSQKQLKGSAKLCLAQWNSELLAPLITTAWHKKFCIKVYISHWGKFSIIRTGKAQILSILQKI